MYVQKHFEHVRLVLEFLLKLFSDDLDFITPVTFTLGILISIEMSIHVLSL